jgi:hypothetical protein
MLKLYNTLSRSKETWSKETWSKETWSKETFVPLAATIEASRMRWVFGGHGRSARSSPADGLRAPAAAARRSACPA